jgi:hypothetical protein
MLSSPCRSAKFNKLLTVKHLPTIKIVPISFMPFGKIEIDAKRPGLTAEPFYIWKLKSRPKQHEMNTLKKIRGEGY